MEITRAPTNRGFERLEFTDLNDVGCSLQESSLASDTAIWLGCSKPNLKKLVQFQGWVPVEMPENHQVTTRMHLNREQVAALLPHLQRFVETGEL